MENENYTTLKAVGPCEYCNCPTPFTPDAERDGHLLCGKCLAFHLPAAKDLGLDFL